MASVLKYPGAKNKLAKWIISYIPEHSVYVEPFFGSGAVFFNKKEAAIETINDIDSEIYNYFFVLRNDTEKLIDAINLTIFSRDEYENAFIDNDEDDKVEKARKFAVKCFMGFGASNNYKNGFRSSQRTNAPITTKIWNELPERLLEASKRIKHAQIENLDYKEILKRYDTSDVFIYLDPPYFPGIRKGYLYKHEMTELQHEELLKIIIKHPGKILISGYECELYEKYLKEWHKEKRLNQVECGLSKEETIYMNYKPIIQSQLQF